MFTEAQAAFLESARVARLATVDAAGRPHVVPVCFALVGGELYTPIDEKPKRGSDPMALRRVRNVTARPDVCLLVDHYEDDWTKLAWLQVRGHAHFVQDGDTRAEVIAALRRRYRPYEAMALEGAPLIAIRARDVVAWAASSARPLRPASPSDPPA